MTAAPPRRITPRRTTPGRSGPLSVARKRAGLLAVAGFVVAALALAAPASAYWTSTGSGVGQGTTGTLAPPTAVSVPAYNLSTVSVPVSWSASDGPLAPEGYYVTRSTGGAQVAACASSATMLVTGTSCADLSVADGTYTYAVTAKYRSWSATAVSAGTVTVLTPTKITFTAQPTGAAAGVAISPNVAVTVQTATDTAVPLAGRSVTVSLTTPAGASLSGTTTTTTNSSGVAVFSGLSIDRAASYTLTAVSSGLTSATSASFPVSAGTSSAFAFTTSPLDAGAVASPTLGPITVRSHDAFGNATVAGVGGIVVNLSSNSAGTNSFAATPAGAPITSVTIPAGNSTASFYYGDTKTGSPVVTASGALVTATQTQAITPADAAKFAITSSPVSGAASATANLGPVRVERQDTYGNPVHTGSVNVALALSLGGTKIFAASAGGASTAIVTIPPGQSGADVYFGGTLAGSPVLTASGALTSAAQTQTVTPATASKLMITSPAVSGVAAAAATLGPVTVERRDQFDNPVAAGSTVVNLSSNSAGTARFSATSGASTATTVTIAGGASQATFFYGDTKAGSPNPTMTVHASGLTDATQAATITPAEVNKLAITSAALSVTASASANRGPLTVERQDEFGNRVSTGGAIAVTLSSNSAGTKIFSASSAGTSTTTVSIPSGGFGVNFYYGDTKAGSPTVTAASGALANATQQQTIAAGPNFRVSFVVHPSTSASGQVITPAITARLEDQWFNPITTNEISITIGIGNDPSLLKNSTIQGTKTRTTTAGVATFNDIRVNALVPLGGFTLEVTSGALATATSNSFSVTLL